MSGVYATLLTLGFVLLLVSSPFWLVAIAGLLFPFLVVAFLVAIPIGVVYNATKKK